MVTDTKWDDLNQTLTFKMTDGNTTIDVVYKGSKVLSKYYAGQYLAATGQFKNDVLEAFKIIMRTD